MNVKTLCELCDEYDPYTKSISVNGQATLACSDCAADFKQDQEEEDDTEISSPTGEVE